jgi:hypothetical protein
MILPDLRRGRANGTCLSGMQPFVLRSEFSYLFRARGIQPQWRHAAGVAVHYAFGAFIGAAYGFAFEVNPRVGIGSGLPLGAAVWLLAEEIALPVTGLSEAPERYPLRDHLNALAAHLVFGSTTEIVRRWGRETLRSMSDGAKDCDAPTSTGECSMTRQKSPHTQSQRNTQPEQSDSEADQNVPSTDDQIYSEMAGAETGSNRSPRQVQTDARSRNTEPETSAHEGSVNTRTPRRPVQGITSHSAAEESERQEKVVKERPDVRAGLNRSK